MKNFNNMMKQAQAMQAKMARMQEELGEMEIEATSGGGMVTVVCNGRQEVLSIRIKPEVVNPEEVDILEDLIMAAITEALIYPAYQTMLSDQTNENSQGKMFGLLNAVNGICQILAAWILAEIPTDYIGGAILLSGVLFLCSAAFIPLILRKKSGGSSQMISAQRH